MVIRANAVVYPRAVMIEPLNTFIANVAMSASRSSNYFAFWA